MHNVAESFCKFGLLANSKHASVIVLGCGMLPWGLVVLSFTCTFVHKCGSNLPVIICRHTILICEQPVRQTQPPRFSGMGNEYSLMALVFGQDICMT